MNLTITYNAEKDEKQFLIKLSNEELSDLLGGLNVVQRAFMYRQSGESLYQSLSITIAREMEDDFF